MELLERISFARKMCNCRQGDLDCPTQAAMYRANITNIAVDEWEKKQEFKEDEG